MRTPEEIRLSAPANDWGDDANPGYWPALYATRIVEALADVCERLDAMLERMPAVTIGATVLPRVTRPEFEFESDFCHRHLGVEDGREVVCGKAAGHEGQCSR